VVIILLCFQIHPVSKNEIQLSRCVDGDTAWFFLNGKEVKVRFLGVDTPETVHPNGIVEEYGKEASDYTCMMLKGAKHIYLEYDENSDRMDKYHRVLGWIFVDDDNLSELLVAKGYAEVKYIYGDYKYLDELCNQEWEAYLNRLGIWSLSSYQYENHYCNQ
jgi:micrococcal nuclease